MRSRITVLMVLFVAAVVGVSLLDRIPQPSAYHGFADTRSWLGIPNVADVVSNLSFVLVGGFGLWRIFGPAGRRTFEHLPDRWPYALFFLGVVLTGIGSAYYHAAPDNARLFWDRLPIAMTIMALFSAFIADRIDRRIGIRWLLPVLIALGVASVWYWDWSESAGRGDLRLYILVQFFPLFALPVICWLFPAGRYTTGRHLAWMIGCYGLAKLFENFDPEVFGLLSNAVSGHSLKHLAASLVVVATIHMLAAARRGRQPNR